MSQGYTQAHAQGYSRGAARGGAQAHAQEEARGDTQRDTQGDTQEDTQGEPQRHDQLEASIELSVLIPVYDEHESVQPLHQQLTEVLTSLGRSYEIVFVDDGSTDGTAEIIEELCEADEHVRAVLFRRNFGKSAALAVGFEEVRGDLVFTMDGDLQDDPAEIPGFLEKLAEGYDLVSGWKQVRRDPITKTWPSKLYNRVTAWVSGVPLHDFNCGYKLYRREVVKSVEIYGELHRYIPVLASRLGFRVSERPVRHHARRFGRSKYGAERLLNGFLDLLTVTFLGRSRRSPLHVFGRIAAVLFSLGMVINLYMLAIWIIERALRVRPLLILGVILVVMAVQFISMGLLAEMMVTPRREDDQRMIRRRIS